MTPEHGSAEIDVKIRAPGRPGLWFGLAALNFGLAVLNLADGKPWFALFWLLTCCVQLFMAYVMRNGGIDLTRECAVVRSPRRRSVPWGEVQAVVSDVKPNGTSVVRLILQGGEQITLRAPIALWRRGDAHFERELQRIVQWWHEHRGESWRPVHPEAPGFVQE